MARAPDQWASGAPGGAARSVKPIADGSAGGAQRSGWRKRAHRFVVADGPTSWRGSLLRHGRALIARGTRQIQRAGIWLAAGLAVLAAGAAVADPTMPCRPHAFEGNDYVVCTLDPSVHDLRLFWRDRDGRPYGRFGRLPEQLDGAALVFAMNAGMYRADLSPVGLYVENGATLREANTRDGPGNFHLMPNGVFFVGPDGAGVLATDDYLARSPAVEIASQSGPMLVIDGEIHPRFLPHSTSRKRRNGVGVRDAGTVVFAISQGTVTFHEFARLYRDSLGIDNALFLDGTMSSLHAPALGRSDFRRPMGPIIAAYARE